jgi:hypothetical protein
LWEEEDQMFADVEKRMDTAIVKTLVDLGYSFEGHCSQFIKGGECCFVIGMDGTKLPNVVEVQHGIERAIAFVKKESRERKFWLCFSYWEKSYEGRGTFKLFDITVKVV